MWADLLAWISAHPQWAYLLVFLVAFGESLAVVGLLVPGATLLVGAGALIALGALDFWPTCLWAVLGAVLGDGLSYWVGHHFQDRLRTIWPFSHHPESLETGERFFAKYGGKSVAFGRFVGPVRAVIPLVAGMMGLSPGRFLFANVVSAFAWAPAYLLPGIVFGASLELAAEAAMNLVLLGLFLVGMLWLAAWLARRLFQALSRRASRWVEDLLRWADFHPHLGEVARALADPQHPDAKTLSALAGLLVLATGVLVLVGGVALAPRPELWLNRTALAFALSLHTPIGDHLMVSLNRLGDFSVVLPLGLGVYLWLWSRGARRQAHYWLAALAFSLGGLLLQPMFRMTRPDIGLDVGPWAFPSLPVLNATLIYGFLAILIAGPLAQAKRWIPYTLATLLILSVILARLYLGAEYFTDILSSLALGLLWLSLLGLSLRRHTQKLSSWQGISTVSCCALMLSFGFSSLHHHGQDFTRYQPTSAPQWLTESQWLAGGWRQLPQFRQDLRGSHRQPLNLQYAGDPETLGSLLEARGWATGPDLNGQRFLRLLSPDLPLKELPVIPHVHAGQHERWRWVKHLAGERRLVLRLWPSAYRLTDGRPLWVGAVTAQGKRLILGLLALPFTESDTQGPLQQIQADLAPLQIARPGPNAPLLLVSPSGGNP